MENIADFSNVSIDEQARLNGRSAKDIFCSSWPAAKTALEAIRAIVKNPIVKTAVGIIIAAGDGLSNRICQ